MLALRTLVATVEADLILGYGYEHVEAHCNGLGYATAHFMHFLPATFPADGSLTASYGSPASAVSSISGQRKAVRSQCWLDLKLQD